MRRSPAKYIDETQLSLSHVGLGNLSEVALLLLFGNAFSRCLTQGVENEANQIKNEQGLLLYPAYFMTDLKIPIQRPLSSFQLWERVQTGVNLQRFGNSLIASRYLLGKPSELSGQWEAWPRGEFPAMEACNLMIVDVTEGNRARHMAIPRNDCIADLPKLPQMPEATLFSKQAREHGAESSGIIRTMEPIAYTVVHGRDAAPGHAMVFAKFTEIMDMALNHFLARVLKPGFSSDLLRYLEPSARRVYYYGNCFAGETLEIYLQGDIRPWEKAPGEIPMSLIPAASIHVQIEVYLDKDQTLLAKADVRKLLAIPAHSQDLLLDVNRLLAIHGQFQRQQGKVMSPTGT